MLAALRVMACRLLEREPLEAVAEACAIAPATLAQWRTLASHGDAPDVHHADGAVSSAFVALPVPSARTARQAEVARAPSPTLTIERPDGLRLHLHGPLEAATLALLLEAGAAR